MFVKNKVSHSNYLFWFTIAITTFSIITILIIVLYLVQYFPSASLSNDRLLAKIEGMWLNYPSQAADQNTLGILNHYVNHISRSFDLMQTALGVLFGTLILTLILLGSQMYMWSRDRKNLNYWKRSGFLCEHLEFLPANRIKLNNIELELNKTQINNLEKLVKKGAKNELLHSRDIGDNGAQAIKRLREELGAKLMEKTLIKVRKHEGYWIEVKSENIHDSRPK